MPVERTGIPAKQTATSLESKIMKLVTRIEERQVIENILRHLGLWKEEGRPIGRSPPERPFRLEFTYEPSYDDIPFGPGSFAE